MAKIKISREVVESLINQQNVKYIEHTNKKINKLISSSIKDLSEKNSYISLKNVVLQPINELLTDAMIESSSFVYFLGINNTQLELNTTNKSTFWKNLKQRFIFAWTNRRKRRRKKKKQENQEPDIGPIADTSKYNIYNLTQDLQDTLIKFLAETSIVYIQDNILEIVGKEEFGPNTKIRIYVVSQDNEVFKQYTGKKNKFIEINVNSRVACLQEKINKVGDNFNKILKLLNSLYFNVNRYIPNQVFIESILVNCPDEFYKGEDIYDVFIKIINYLSYKSLKDIKSINNPEKTILQDVVTENSTFGYVKMLNSILDKDD